MLYRRTVAGGAGAGARGRDGAEDEDRQQQQRQREREKGGGTAAVYRMADKLQGAGGSEVDDQVGGNPGAGADR